jgi:hypothetical protein
MARKQWFSVGDLTHEGFVNGDGVTCYTTDTSGDVTSCSYTSAPSATAGYAVGCEFTNSTTGAKSYNTGSTTSCTFTAGSFAGGMVIGTATTGLTLSGAYTTGIYVSGTATNGIRLAKTVTSGIRIGDWVGSSASGSAVTFGTGMNYYSDGQLDILSVFGEATGDLTGAYSAKCARFRNLISCAADTVIGQETYGAIGQVVIKNGSLNHYHAGLMGTIETGTLCHVQTSYCVSGVCARLGGSGTTVESGGLLAGVAAIQHMSAFTNSGTMAGFATHKTSVGLAWPVGLYMQSGSVTQGINIACVSQALYATVSTVAGAGSLTGSALCVYATGAAGNQGVGIVAYLDATATGQSTADWTYGAGIWLNLDVDWKQNLSGGWGGHEQVCPLSVGIYAPHLIGTDVNDTDIIYGIKAELVSDGSPFPTTNGCYFAALNVSQTAATRTAIFFAHQNDAVGLGATKSGAAGGSIALVDINGTMHYVNTFTS